MQKQGRQILKAGPVDIRFGGAVQVVVLFAPIVFVAARKVSKTALKPTSRPKIIKLELVLGESKLLTAICPF